MGISNSAMPPPDQYTLKKMEFAHIKMKELKRFWKYFRKMDKNLSGTIELNEFYKTIEEKRSIIGDAMFELNDCSQSGTLDFGEFFCSVVTYCLFEREEILRYCFYIFDRDKNGYIEQDELKMMVNILYGIAPTEKLRGNTRVALESLEFNSDGKVDFKEFKEFNKEFPALFYPAFRMQVQLRVNFGGEKFWLTKARYLQDKRDRIRAREEYTKRKEQRRLRKLQQRKIRKKMGFCRFVCCPAERHQYEDMFPIETKEKSHAEMQKEEVEKKRKQREQARIEAEMAIKNPETDEWKLYLNKKAAKTGTKRTLVRAAPTISTISFDGATSRSTQGSETSLIVVSSKRQRARERAREDRREQRRAKKLH